MFNFIEKLILIITDRIIAAILTVPGLDKNTPYKARVIQYKKVLKEIEMVEYD